MKFYRYICLHSFKTFCKPRRSAPLYCPPLRLIATSAASPPPPFVTPLLGFCPAWHQFGSSPASFLLARGLNTHSSMSAPETYPDLPAQWSEDLKDEQGQPMSKRSGTDPALFAILLACEPAGWLLASMRSHHVSRRRCQSKCTLLLCNFA